MLLEDEHGDEVSVDFYDDGTMELAVLSGDPRRTVTRPQLNDKLQPIRDDEEKIVYVTEGQYLGGAVLNKENGKRLVRRMLKWLGTDIHGEVLDD